MEIYIELLKKLIRLRPVSADIPAVNRVQETLQAFLEERNVLCTMEEINGRKVLYASTVQGKNPDLLLNSHVDVVPVEDPIQFEPVICDGWICGRGSGDCLGNAVCLAKVLCEGSAQGLSVGVIFSGDEEIGGSTTEYMTGLGYAARKLVCILDGNSDAISYAQKGTMNVRLTAQGRGGHSSVPWAFENAADKLIEGYSRFKAQWQNPTAKDNWHNSMALTVFNAGIITNKIPDTAELVLNFRYIRQQDREEIVRQLREITQLEVELLSYRDPVTAEKEAPVLQLLAQVMKKHLQKEPPFYRMDAATDASYFVNGSVPVAILGTNSVGAHEKEEKAELASIEKYAAIFKELANQL